MTTSDENRATPDPTATGKLRQWPSALVLVVALIVAAFAYAPGTGGSLHFDDPFNLGGLGSVVDGVTAIDFVINGNAGPTGRPLALASFVPQAYAWPNSPDVFLYVNICLHLLNGVLVVWLVYLLCLARRAETQRAASIAVASAAIWMLLPILASSSLLIVQRMTVLSSTFALLGFIGYLYSRAALVRRPLAALALMSASVGVGTVLATLAKENGALLPVFILVTELTLLSPPTGGPLERLRKAWFGVFLITPAIALMVYLGLHLRYDESTVLVRGFSASERLLTEASVLWEYLFRAFVPAVPAFGPFHDDQAVHRDWLEPLSLLAVLAWAIVIAGAIAGRRRFPWFSFAVAWYLAGHALESTTIALELYFEHRNYLPLIGPVVALVAVAMQVARVYRLVARGVLAVYGLLLAFLLFDTTSLWGNPALAADMWGKYRPNSLRATLYLSEQLQRTDYYQAARNILTDYIERNPRSGTIRLQILELSCGIEPETPQAAQIETLKGMLPDAVFEYGAFDSVQRLNELASRDACDAVVNRETAYTLASVLAENQVFAANPLMRHNLHVLLAEGAFERRDLDLTMHHLETALEATYTVTTLMFAVEMLNSAGLQSVAAEFVQDAYSHVPKRSLQAAVWRQQLAVLERATEVAVVHE